MNWLRLVLDTDGNQAGALAEGLEQAGALAVSLSDYGNEPLYEPGPGDMPLWQQTRITALFEADTDISGVIHALAQHLPGPLPHWHLEPLADQDWMASCRSHFQPIRFGADLWICPSWHTPPQPDAINLMLDPGLAFGTGSHPTTAMCLEWLAGFREAGRLRADCVIDYGCGSGILAIAAAKLGATQVYAVDVDPQALLATRDNAARNGVVDRIHTCLPPELPAVTAELLVANILAGPLLGLTRRFAALLQPGGRVVLSGLLETQADQVRDAYRAWFDMDPPLQRDGWICLAGSRRNRDRGSGA